MLVRAGVDGLVPAGGRRIKYLTPAQLDVLVKAFEDWMEAAGGERQRMRRLRHWVIFLTLRYTGARLGEVLMIDDGVDVDIRAGEIRIVNLKRHNPRRKGQYRQVPVPSHLIAEIAKAWAEFPELKGNLFRIDPSVFRKVFLARCREAGIERELSHPHVLRHTRAIELLRAGVPVTAVQQLLGHSFLSTNPIVPRGTSRKPSSVPSRCIWYYQDRR
jgi:molybdate transport system regulatory protein